MNPALAFFALVAVATVSASQKHPFHIDVLEKSLIVHQEGEIDLDEGTIKTTMPAHNGLDAVTTFADYKHGVSVRKFPKKNRCVVMDLEKDWFPDPMVILDQLDIVESDVWSNVPNTTNSYTLGASLDVDSLPEEIQTICEGSDVYELVRDVETKLIDSKDMSASKVAVVDTSYSTETRVRRAEIDYCPRDYQRTMCYVESSWCGYTMQCYVDRLADGKDMSVCKDHKYGQIRCCKPCCLIGVPANNPSPYCGTMPQTESYLCSR